jgi:hypothetical protein
MEWKIDDVEHRLEEILESVDELGPQRIRSGTKVYVLSPASGAGSTRRNKFVDYLVNGPDWDDVVIERIPGTLRDVDL